MFLPWVHQNYWTCFFLTLQYFSMSFYMHIFLFALVLFPFPLLKPILLRLQWQNFPTGINKAAFHLIFYESEHRGKTISNTDDTVIAKWRTGRWPGEPLLPHFLDSSVNNLHFQIFFCKNCDAQWFEVLQGIRQNMQRKTVWLKYQKRTK